MISDLKTQFLNYMTVQRLNSLSSTAFDAKEMLDVHILRDIISMGPFAAFRIDVRTMVRCKYNGTVISLPEGVHCISELSKGGNVITQCLNSLCAIVCFFVQNIIIFTVVSDNKIIIIGLDYFDGAYARDKWYRVAASSQ